MTGVQTCALPISARANGISYSRLMNGLKKSGMEINRKMLSEIAIHDTASFAKLCEKDEFDEIGVISIDSSFTPVRKVNYKVENTRVGQITDYDKLILEVWTNGTVTAKEAISEGVDILISNLGLFTELPSQKSQEIKEDDAIEHQEFYAVWNYCRCSFTPIIFHRFCFSLPVSVHD